MGLEQGACVRLLKMAYRIRTVSELTGIPRNTLIAWERRYGFIKPERRENGYRSYSEADVDKLRRVQNAIHAGLKISEAIHLLEKDESLSPTPQIGETLQGESGFAQMSEQLTRALVNYERERADVLLQKLTTVPFATRLHEVFFPVLTRIGDMWESGEVSVAQEHYASAVLRTHFAGILLGLGTRGRHAPHAACTTFVGEQHELAALALAIHLSLAGQRVSYLGPDLPADEVVRFCISQKVQVLCVSLVQTTSARDVKAYARVVAQAAESGTRIVLGGRALENLRIQVPEGVEIIPKWHDLQV